ncbi:glycosyl hydrolase-related protein [Labilibaculum sp. DW002]|uniref:Glycosyl hydrolase-related protein n=1 Tax=Paralabilibaculum antarcticum TaxID=2912572 RepID=A0ABT5VPN8_9BACT|nr:glycosyl hydrolase-related protein [Labilibaculum sp. DW002]MDE5417395.1 glycosyl hydrolase-related protein [Labilibaculum sp. DW002]
MKTRTNLRLKIVLLTILSITLFSSGKLQAHESAGKSQIHNVNDNYHLYQICKNDVEGFTSQLSGGMYGYPALRSDIRDAMIARASTGKAGFEFLTAKVPTDLKEEMVNFFFYSDIDLNNLYPYDIKVNGQPLLTFVADKNGKLQIKNSVGNANAQYYLYRRDANGDGVGAFRLSVPAKMLVKGEKAKISVFGHAKGTNAWFMLFKVPNAIQWLKKAALNDVSFSIKQFADKLLIDAPARLVGQKVYVISDGKKSKAGTFKLQGETAKASVTSLAPKKSFQIVYGKDKFEVEFEKGDGVINENVVKGDYFYASHAHSHNGWLGDLSKRYRPDFFDAYTPLFQNKYEKGLISIMNSSHQDIAWMDNPEACIIERDTLLFTPILKDAFERSDYGFDVEDGLMIREYIERHPESQAKITELLKRKLLSVGATYNCPYEDMYDGEDLVRQLYLGKKWVKKNFGGYDSKVYWNVDVPGKTMQLPQILSKAGVNYMIISRHAKSMTHWESPDGSTVFTYSPGHYGEDLIHLSKGIDEKVKYGAEQIEWWSQYFKGGETQTPLLSSQDMLPAIDYTEFIEEWNETETVLDENGKEQNVYFPHMELMTVDEFMPLAEQHATTIDTIRGERPNVWVYIHGPAHHDALTASRKASKLLPAAEKFLTVASFMDEEKMPYPFEDLDKGWQAKIYPDHGWGGHDGDITDNLFKESLVESQVIGEKLLGKATNFIAQRVKTQEKKGIPVVLFNSLSWERTDPVTVSVDLPKGKANGLSVISSNKVNVPVQFTKVIKHADGSIKHAEIVFIAENLPSVGYKTYYLKPEMKSNVSMEVAKYNSEYENDFYKVTFADGGIDQVYDKELKKNLFTTNEFKVGEIFTLQSEGNGAGEFGDVQQPFMKNFDQVSIHNPKWKLVASGEVFSTYRLEQEIRHAKVEKNVTIYHKLKRIQFDNKLHNWDGEMYREFRTAYPIAIENSTVCHEVPYGTVQVGRDEINSAGERYTPLCKDVHPRAIMDWISAEDKEHVVTLSSSVAAADWINPTKDGDADLLQHVLLASRKSCHWAGNEYSQAGSHSYSHILTSNKVGDVAGSRVSKQFNEPITVVVNPEKSTKANLAENVEFFSIDQENVIVTAIKKAEDSEALVVRLYDTEGKEVSVNLKSFFGLENLQHTNIIEEYPKAVKQIKVTPFAIETYQLDVK